MNRDNDWRPTATAAMLRKRARMLADIREFFAARSVMEVETPYLSLAGSTELHLHSLATRLRDGRTHYLHTSPEYPMKRLLAAGSGPIWQICRVFRDGESGRRHNPEFTLLEWYRPGFAIEDLVGEVRDLAIAVGAAGEPGESITYRDAFRRHAGVDPFEASAAELAECAAAHGQEARGMERSQWLDLLFSDVVCGSFEPGRPVTVTRFPAEQASLARVAEDDPACAERFEYFIGPLELANGFHELADANEQERRFRRDNRARAEAGLPRMPVDERLLDALRAGLPDCCGVALGLDRLLMAVTGADTIGEVMAFPKERA